MCGYLQNCLIQNKTWDDPMLYIRSFTLTILTMLYLFFIQSTSICLAPTFYYSLSSYLGENRGDYDMVMTHG